MPDVGAMRPRDNAAHGVMAVLIVAASGPGCFWLAAGGAATATSADGTPAIEGTAGGSSLGNLDGELLEEITDTAAIQQMDARVDDHGALVAVALRHFDGPAIPVAVRALVTERYPGASLVYFGTTHEAGQTVLYDALVQTGEDRQCTVAAEGDGSLVYTECDIDAAALPPPVGEAVARLGEGEIVRVAQRDAPAQTVFIVEKRIAQRTHVLELNAEGDILEHDVLLPATIRIPYLGRPLHEVDPDAVRGDRVQAETEGNGDQAVAPEPPVDAVSPE